MEEQLKIWIFLTVLSLASHRITADSACWSRFNDTNVRGGISQPSIATEEDCKWACVNSSVPCLGIDWNTVNPPRCWFQTNATDPTKYNQTGITHWDLNVTCITGLKQGSSTQGSAVTMATRNSTSMAQGSSTRDPAFTTATRNSTSRPMTQESSSSTQGPAFTTATRNSTSQTTGGVTSFTTTGRPTVSSMTSTTVMTSTASRPSTPGPPATIAPPAGCGYSWASTNNSHILGGQQQNSLIANESSCLRACESSFSCIGTDWNWLNIECWFQTNLSNPNKQTQSGITHWDLTRFCLDQNSAKCPNVWSLTSGAAAASGKVLVDVASESDCKASCITNSSCQGVDWNGSQCYLITSSVITQLDATSVHWDLTRQANATCTSSCVYTWTFQENYSDLSAVKTSSTNEYTCRSGCLQTPSCTGAQYSSDGTCSISISQSATVTTPGTNYWSIKRWSNCAQCIDAWTISAGYQDQNAAYMPALTSEGDCKTACTNILSCTGYEFSGSRCSLSASRFAWISSAGAVHNEIFRSPCGSSCSGGWILWPNTISSNRTLNGTTSESGCKNACVNYGPNCLSIDYVPSTKQCYLCFSSNTSTLSGINHFIRIMDINCASPIKISTEFPTASTTTSTSLSATSSQSTTARVPTVTTACQVQWENLTDVNSINCQLGSSNTTGDDCAARCVNTLHCVAATYNTDVNADPGKCYLCLSPNNTLPDKYQTKGVTSYRILNRC